MTPLVRRVLARVVVAAAVSLVVITLVGRCEQHGARDIDVELDVGAVAGVRSAHLELRRGHTVVAWVDRQFDGGLTGPLHLKGPALGADGEVRIELDTDDGPRHVRRPLKAAGGSAVTIRCGVSE